MFNKFLCCFKQKISAILMVYTSLAAGSVGTIYFSIKISHNADKFDSHFLVISIFHILTSFILGAAVIWERPLLVLIFEFTYISVLTSFLAFLTLYAAKEGKYWIWLIFIITFMGTMLYWLCCIHTYYRQLRLKLKSTLNYVDADVYSVCNKLYENQHTINM